MTKEQAEAVKRVEQRHRSSLAALGVAFVVLVVLLTLALSFR